MTERLLLEEHYSDTIAARLRAGGHGAVALVAEPQLRAQPDIEVFRYAAASGRRIVTENIKDFRPLLQQAFAAGEPTARLLLVPPNRFPRGVGRRTTVIAAALSEWLTTAEAEDRPEEDWLV